MFTKLPLAKSKSVMITGAISIGTLLYKVIDAAGNAEFLWQKVGLSTNAAQFLGSARTIDFTVAGSLLALVFSLLYQANRLTQLSQASSVEPPPVEGSGGQTTTSDGRIIVSATPEYLAGIFDEHTDVQGKKLVEPYIGKWMKTSGTVGQVVCEPDLSQVLILRKPGIAIPMVVADFKEQKWIDRLGVLKRGEKITVLGQISRAQSMAVQLENCEIVASDSTS